MSFWTAFWLIVSLKYVIAAVGFGLGIGGVCGYIARITRTRISSLTACAVFYAVVAGFVALFIVPAVISPKVPDAAYWGGRLGIVAIKVIYVATIYAAMTVVRGPVPSPEWRKP